MLLTCFKTYDVRGELGVNFDTTIAYRIGRAVAQHFKADKIVVGHDTRQSSPSLSKAVISGIRDFGATVLDLGLSGTEEMYWAVTEFGACAGIEITASHNPINFNGLKFVKSGSKPLSIEKDLKIIKKLAELNSWKNSNTIGCSKDVSTSARVAYVNKVLSFVNLDELKTLKIVVNSGNGAAGPTFDAIYNELTKKNVSLEIIRMFHEPDHTFPNGIPNPMLTEHHVPMREVIKKHQADFGIAFDGDFDRCFFFDEQGNFVSGEYIIGLLASVFLDNNSKAKIVHDSRVIWNVQDLVGKKNGTCLVSKTGHAFIKKTMRDHEAIYGGELSAHHYFKDFAYCDSGMIPWLLMIELISRSGISLGELVNKRIKKFPSSGEINFEISNSDKMIDTIKDYYGKRIKKSCNLDGLSLEFRDWRLNLRKSNTESLLRLNVESKRSRELVDKKVKELSNLIISSGQ